MTRVFIAADFDEAFLDAAAAMPFVFPNARRVKRETMHCTVRFFGEVDDARVLVLPIEDDGSLARIHENLGREERPYQPHLTLARFKEPADVRALVDATPVDLRGTVVGIRLYQSVLGKHGPTYTRLAQSDG